MTTWSSCGMKGEFYRGLDAWAEHDKSTYKQVQVDGHSTWCCDVGVCY